MEFEDLLLKENILIAFITETFLKPSKIFNLDEYHIKRCDRRRGNEGGVLIAVKHGMALRKIDVDLKMESVAVEVELGGKIGTIPDIAAFNPPNGVLAAEDMTKICRLNRFICGGDLKAKNVVWRSRRDNKNERKIVRVDN